jgi:hypothetical protein
MYNFLNKKGTMLAFLVSTVLSLIFIFVAISGISADNLGGVDLTTMKAEMPTMKYFDFGLWSTIALIVICCLLFLLFMVVDVVKFPKQMMKTIIAIVAVIILFFVIKAAMVAETGPIWSRLAVEYPFNESQSKGISAGIWVTIALLAGAILTMVISEVRNFFK